MSKNYIIYAPKLCKSNGVKVLYKLADLLNQKGYNAYMYARPSEDSHYKYIDAITPQMRQNDIVIYPEITKGNPLQFQNVVRYVLYFPGKIGGAKEYFHSEEIFTFSSQYIKNAPELGIPTLDTNLFYQDDTPKTIDSYFVYKGGKWKEIPEFKNMIEINNEYPATREELANLLRKTKTLYSYDKHSILLDEAHLCGCNVKLITKEGFVDYKSKYWDAYKNTEEQLSYFIEKTQNMNYKGDIEPISFCDEYRYFKAQIKYLFHKYISHNKNSRKKYFYKFKRMI